MDADEQIGARSGASVNHGEVAGGNDVRLSKFLSLVLRHDPARIGLRLDPNGWAEIDDLLEQASQHGLGFTENDLRRVVATNSKQRFSLDESTRRVRASQGHSIHVDLGLAPTRPPAALFHGTAERFLPSIWQKGLMPMGRQHVHLSEDATTASAVGCRHGPPAILVVDADRMHADGHSFFVSANGVWLVDAVPSGYLTRHSDTGV